MPPARQAPPRSRRRLHPAPPNAASAPLLPARQAPPRSSRWRLHPTSTYLELLGRFASELLGWSTIPVVLVVRAS
jgi:hypothetical protein